VPREHARGGGARDAAAPDHVEQRVDLGVAVVVRLHVIVVVVVVVMMTGGLGARAR
jgi:hypothetical protein